MDHFRRAAPRFEISADLSNTTVSVTQAAEHLRRPRAAANVLADFDKELAGGGRSNGLSDKVQLANLPREEEALSRRQIGARIGSVIPE